MTVITNMPMYQAIALRQALLLYAKTGMKVNRAYTPTNMFKLASQITGKKYKRGEYETAASDLNVWLEVRKLEGQTLQDQVDPVMLGGDK